MNSKKIWVILVVLFFLAGASGGFFLFRKLTLKEKPPETPGSVQDNAQPGADEITALRFYYPVDGRLALIEKKVSRRTKQLTMAGTVVEEYFKGPGNDKSSQFPQNVKLLGIYRDASQMLYVDLSDELRRNFQGDALSEYLLLKGVYESLISNLQDVQDIKILIEGKEAETLGGHIYLKYPLKNTVAYEFKGDSRVSDE
jgi:spore germination protein GerM